MNRQSIFRAMAFIVVMLAVSINLNAQKRTGATATDVKQEDAKPAEATLSDAKLEDSKQEPAPVLTLDPSMLLLEVGQVQKIAIKDHSTKEKIEWLSSNKEVALVNDDGTVKAISAGKAVITATSGKAEGKCDVAVKNPEPTTLTLEPSKLSLKQGETQKITIKDALDGEKPKWTSSDEKIAIVNEEGIVKAINAGKVVITASKGKAEGKCEVAVEKAVSSDKNAKEKE